MKNKPTLEEMEEAWRGQGVRIEALAKTMPIETPRRDTEVTLCRSVLAAVVALALLPALPQKTMAATPVASLDKCCQRVESLLLYS